MFLRAAGASRRGHKRESILESASNMNPTQHQAAVYLCPMHPDVRLPNPGRCAKCRMELLPEGTRFGMLRHMAKSPIMIVAMVVIMVAAMVMVMM
jgi:hypothetical protein